MKIRHKLLLLLLFFSTVPLLSSMFVSNLTFYRSGMHLAEETAQTITEQAHGSLQEVVRGFQRQQDSNQHMLEFALDHSIGINDIIHTDDSASPAPLSSAYSVLAKYKPRFVTRQITIFETGRTLIYPQDDIDLEHTDSQQLPWYQAVRKRQSMTRTLATDPGDGRRAIITAKPLYGESHKFIGATALVRPVSAIFADLQLPDAWSDVALEMLVANLPATGSEPGGLRILAIRDNQNVDHLKNKLQPGDLLRPDLPADNRQLLAQVASQKGGSLQLNLHNEETHWIFSSSRDAEPFALILVPHTDVIAQAITTRQHVISKTIRGLKLASLLLAVVVVAVFLTSTLAAKKISRPLANLAIAAEQLAAGDFKSRVEIKTGDEIETLGQAFNHLGPALAEREQMARSLALAGDIQRHLLPRKQPDNEQFELFGGTLPCDETGGDYYDFIPLPGPDQLALTLGDVSGHGIGAALLMAGARGVLRSHAPDQKLSIAQLFAIINRHLCRDTADEQFMTLFYAILDSNERSMRWCSAGHGPVLLYRKQDDQIYEFGSTGLPLGILTETSWQEAEPLSFCPGDILLIGSDGIWEAQNRHGEQFGLTRFKRLILRHTDTSAAQLHAAVLAGVDNFRQGEPQDDDVTLIVLKTV